MHKLSALRPALLHFRGFNERQRDRGPIPRMDPDPNKSIRGVTRDEFLERGRFRESSGGIKVVVSARSLLSSIPVASGEPRRACAWKGETVRRSSDHPRMIVRSCSEPALIARFSAACDTKRGYVRFRAPALCPLARKGAPLTIRNVQRAYTEAKHRARARARNTGPV